MSVLILLSSATPVAGTQRKSQSGRFSLFRICTLRCTYHGTLRDEAELCKKDYVRMKPVKAGHDIRIAVEARHCQRKDCHKSS